MNIIEKAMDNKGIVRHLIIDERTYTTNRNDFDLDLKGLGVREMSFWCRMFPSFESMNEEVEC